MENSYRDWYPWELTSYSLSPAYVQSRLWLLWVYFVDWQRFCAGCLSSAVQRTWENSCLFPWESLDTTSSFPPAFCKINLLLQQTAPANSLLLMAHIQPMENICQLQRKPPSVLALSDTSQHKFSKTSNFKKYCSSSPWGPVRNLFLILEARCSAFPASPTSLILSLSPPATTWPPTLSKGDHLKNISPLCRSFYWMKHFKTPRIIVFLCELCR